MQVWYISDGKAGHRSQALGLVAALQRQLPEVSLQEIPVHHLVVRVIIVYWLSFGLIGQRPEIIKNNQNPDLIIGVGHRTHWSVLLLKKLYPNAKTLILMRPSLPLAWFDYLIIPKHDHPTIQPNIFISQGVLNPIVDEQRHLDKRGLILIGGPSKRHGWSINQLIAQLQRIIQQFPQQEMILTTSRRTPADFFQHPFFTQRPETLKIMPVEQTPTGWLFEQLQLASTVWVTEDSISMLYEALSAGCDVRLIEMPRLKQDRITASIDDLLSQQLVKKLDSLPVGSSAIMPLNEADRAADWLIANLCKAD